MGTTTVEPEAPVRREPVWVRGASVMLAAVLAVAAYLAFLTAAGNGPSCPAIYPPPEGCEPERGLDTIVAIGVPFGALLGAAVAVLATRRLPAVVRAAVLVGVVVVSVAVVAWTAALRG